MRTTSLAYLLSGAPWLPLLAGFTLAALASWGFSVVVAGACRRFGLLDQPDGRHQHASPAPRLGGIAIFLAFALAALALYRPSSPYEAHVALGLFLASALTVTVMAIDDVRGLPPLPRLLAQTAAALLVMFPGAHGMIIEVIHNPLASGAGAIIPLPLWVAIPFTWFWITGMMNTINWVDGVDGLAGGTVAIASVVMAAVSFMLGQYTVAALCAMLAGATVGFLLLNWRPGKLFMGDSGAMFLGLALATLAGVGGAKLATMLLLLGLPILDAARVIVRRIGRGASPMRADSSHLHHRMLANGFSARQVALTFYAVTAAFGAITILAAYLQAHAWQWSATLRLAPWLPLALAGAPIILGLALVPAVTGALWLIISRRRKLATLRAAHATTITRPLPPDTTPTPALTASSASRRPHP